MIIEGTKDESKLLRWVQNAQSEDEARPVLASMHVTEGYVMAGDGFRLHATPTPPCLGNALGKQIKGKVPAGEFIAKVAEVEGTYPDMFQVMPVGEAGFAIAVNAKYLREALQGIEGRVILRFQSSKTAFEVFDEHGERYALIMPAHLCEDVLARRGWRPEKETVGDD